ncbi:unnamed protein product [Durusdinium trenchii]|uniref:Autophagy-related protein 18a n=2 Tax=Durusdinium trenchii TaxID=1381693 RepID=A0ABP0I160_9DINO
MAQLAMLFLFIQQVFGHQDAMSFACSNQSVCDERASLIQLKAASGTCPDDFDDGDCSADNSCQCTPQSDSEEIGAFPNGVLQCSGENSCTSADVGVRDTNFFKFVDPDDYLECTAFKACGWQHAAGAEAGLAGGYFNVKNIGALCCAVPNLIFGNNGVCSKSKFTMASSTKCSRDACCHGTNICRGSDLIGVRSLSCYDREACSAGNYAEVEKDVHCLGDYSCCRWSKEGRASTFKITTGEGHCVTCGGLRSCQVSQWKFTQPSDTDMNCTGEEACDRATISVNGGCFKLLCDGVRACRQMDLTLSGGAECSCTAANSGQCPDKCAGFKICAEPTPCGAERYESITCAASGPDQTDCAAACDDSGRAQGDPHIQTLRGAHYTILKEGNFLAWSYSKTTSFKSKMGLEKEIPLQWKLYARYGGSFFSTKGLLLVDVNRSLALELTSEDCAWRQRIGQDGEWHKVKPVLLTSEDNATSFNVSDVRQLSGDDLLGATIILNMNSKHGLQPVARLVSHCKPGDHMDFKLNMFQKSDISFVGGELGVGHEAMSTGGTGEVHFLSSKLKTMQLRTDTEFEAKRTWLELGGSDRATSYFGTFGASASLATTMCTAAEEEKAGKICAKHLPGSDSEVLADCIFDVCHGGGELAAVSAGLLISA